MFGSEKLSQAAPQPHRAADVTTDKEIPAAFDPATGLAAQPATSGKTWTDSIYVNSEVKAGGHDFGIHVITLRQPDVDQYSLSVVVTDETSGWYKRYGVPIAQHDYHWSTSGLDIKMPGLTWKGNAQRMSLKATTPWGGLDIKLVPKGPALNSLSASTAPRTRRPRTRPATASTRHRLSTPGSTRARRSPAKTTPSMWATGGADHVLNGE
ncbi:hypothetical protein OOK36_34920 [Streptomyces sp. NBC_00365]|uniref:hypothetical protein n=1 Tax=Streptomyces sp. NBC_00365 TaxID=2975726 RepID=UPI00225A854C|nr:hypothetical protein [Streptomyces sp. NBC_00365]MCX5093978.1 hypothetical protein [Streptomyces sp. NBC_00365]